MRVVTCPGCGKEVQVPWCPVGGGVSVFHECNTRILSAYREPVPPYAYIVKVYGNHHSMPYHLVETIRVEKYH